MIYCAAVKTSVRTVRDDAQTASGACVIPFSIDRFSGKSLADQIADGIRGAVASGVYRSGDVLPTRKQFARALKVSERAPREAVAALAREGLVYTQRCVGTTVAEKGVRRCRGRVLFVETGDCCSYFHSALRMAFWRKLTSSGYLVTDVVCPRGSSGAVDLLQLETALRRHMDFAVTFQNEPRILSLIERAGVRFLSLARDVGDYPHCAGRCSLEVDGAVSRFLAHCRKRRVRSVLQVGLLGEESVLDVRSCATDGELSVATWDIPRGTNRSGVENITHAVQCAFSNRIAANRRWLPDVLLFRDDYVARGALSALLSAGVRIPEEVRVVTLSNRGNCPVFPKTLARIEIDPVRCGVVNAEHVLSALGTGTRGREGTAEYHFVRGATFP